MWLDLRLKASSRCRGNQTFDLKTYDGDRVVIVDGLRNCLATGLFFQRDTGCQQVEAAGSGRDDYRQRERAQIQLWQYCSAWNLFEQIPPRRYEQRPIRIAWVFENNARETRKFVLEVPSSFETGLALRGVLAITPAGSISAYFE